MKDILHVIVYIRFMIYTFGQQLPYYFLLQLPVTMKSRKCRLKNYLTYSVICRPSIAEKSKKNQIFRLNVYNQQIFSILFFLHRWNCAYQMLGSIPTSCDDKDTDLVATCQDKSTQYREITEQQFTGTCKILKGITLGAQGQGFN